MKKYTKCIENLRKYSMAMAAVLCCATATTALTSCGDDDPADTSSNGSGSDNSTPSNETKATAMRVIVNFAVTPDLLNYCDVKVEYQNGKNKEDLTLDAECPQLIDTIQVNSPGELTIKTEVTKKADKDIASATGNIYWTYYYASKFDLLDAANNSISDYTYTKSDFYILEESPKIDKAKIAEKIDNGEFNYTYTYKIDENGKITPSSVKSNSSTKATTTPTTTDPQVGWARRTHPTGGWEYPKNVKSNSSTTTTSDTQVGWARRTHPTGGWEYPKNAKSNSSTTTTSDTQVGWARRTHPTGEKSRSVKSNSSTITTSDTQVGMVRK